ncbi:hypothetical protein GW916_08425 [bacterium]|nr:hypothetical protein [bacterium]
MTKSTALRVLIGMFLTLKASLVSAENLSPSTPFKSRDAMVMTLIESGFDDIFEFPGNSVKTVIVSSEVDGQQRLVLRRSSVKQVVGEEKNIKRVESLDYLGEGLVGVDVAGLRIGKELFEAYKISNYAICHKLSSRQVSVDAGDYVLCMIFPRPVDEVLSTLENKGVIEP